MLDTVPHRIEEYDGVVIGRISDYNSNTYEKDGTRTNENGHNDTRFYDNGVLSQEIDSSIQDSSDYQWFTDYRWATTSACNRLHRVEKSDHFVRATYVVVSTR